MTASRADRIGLWLMATVGAAIIGLVGLSQSRADGPIAVVFPPWVASGEALATAVLPGARLVGKGRFGFVVIVSPDSPDYTRRIRGLGALFSIDAAAFVGCLAKPSAST